MEEKVNKKVVMYANAMLVNSLRVIAENKGLRYKEIAERIDEKESAVMKFFENYFPQRLWMFIAIADALDCVLLFAEKEPNEELISCMERVLKKDHNSSNN